MLLSVLHQVTNPIYLADPPGRRGGSRPAVCLTEPGANHARLLDATYGFS